MSMLHQFRIIDSVYSIVSILLQLMSFIYLAYQKSILAWILMYFICQKNIGYSILVLTLWHSRVCTSLILIKSIGWYISVMRGSKVLKNPITWQRLTIDQKRISRLFLSIRVIANIWLLPQIITSVLLPPPTYFKIGML